MPLLLHEIKQTWIKLLFVILDCIRHVFVKLCHDLLHFSDRIRGKVPQYRYKVREQTVANVLCQLIAFADKTREKRIIRFKTVEK